MGLPRKGNQNRQLWMDQVCGGVEMGGPNREGEGRWEGERIQGGTAKPQGYLKGRI